jgi:hypothetical protein
MNFVDSEMSISCYNGVCIPKLELGSEKKFRTVQKEGNREVAREEWCR